MLISVFHSGFFSVIFLFSSHTTLSHTFFIWNTHSTLSLLPPLWFTHIIRFFLLYCNFVCFLIYCVYTSLSSFYPSQSFPPLVTVSVSESMHGYFLCKPLAFVCDVFEHMCMQMCLHPSAGICNICAYSLCLCICPFLFSFHHSLSLSALISSPSVTNQPETCPIAGRVLWVGSG